MNRSAVHRSIFGLSMGIAIMWFGASFAQDGGPVVEVAEHPTLGTHLIDGRGMSLYLFAQDEGVEGSACADDCAEVWPPLLVEDAVTFGEGVDLGMLGSAQRDDGTRQLTYGGWPLYSYREDLEPGAVAGHGANDAWFLVSPTGEAVAPEQSQDPAASEDAAEESGEAGEGASEAESSTDAGEEEAAPEGEAATALMDEGSSIYTSHCAQCHGENGRESGGGAATLAGNSVLDNEGRVARQILFGSQYMPAFGQVLSDHEVAAVGTYIRNSWGNDFGILPEEEVSEERARFD